MPPDIEEGLNLPELPKAKCPKCRTPVLWLVVSLASYLGDLMRTGVCDCPRSVQIWDGRYPNVATVATDVKGGDMRRRTYSVEK